MAIFSAMNQLSNWRPPEHWTRITTIDMHTGGEPLRVVVAGLPTIEGRTVLEKRRYFREHYDYLRTGLMWEPRGHADMYGAVIALTKLAVETGLVKSSEIAINVPAGRIRARATVVAGQVVEASFQNVPSFVYLRGQRVEVVGLGVVE